MTKCHLSLKKVPLKIVLPACETSRPRAPQAFSGTWDNLPPSYNGRVDFRWLPRVFMNTLATVRE